MYCQLCDTHLKHSWVLKYYEAGGRARERANLIMKVYTDLPSSTVRYHRQRMANFCFSPSIAPVQPGLV